MTHGSPSRRSRALIPFAVVLLTVALLLAVSSASSASPPAGPGVQGAVRDYATEFAVPGMVAVVVDRNGAVTTVPHGTTSDRREVTPDTRFRIASMSKAFTAVAVLQVVEQGRLALDTPVADVLPGFGVDDPRSDRITVGHLLSHTSGLAATDVDEFALPPAASPSALVQRLRDVPLAHEPGTVHEYLNAHYVVAARIVETMTGRPFADHLRDAVFLPLGMRSTLATDRCDARVPGLPLGHVGALGVQVPAPEIPALCTGDGGVITTAADLTRWLRFQLGDEPGPLGPASLVASHTPAPGTGGRYGLGWSVRAAEGGHTRVLHGGAITTWTSAIEMSSAGSGAFVLTDAAGAAGLLVGAPGLLAGQLVARADGIDPGPPPADPTRPVDAALLGAVLVAAALLVGAVVRAGRRAERLRCRRRWISLPAVSVVVGAALLPALWALVVGWSPTGWAMLLWMLPLAGVLATVLVAGGAAALVARSRARRVGAPRTGARRVSEGA